ncbi:TERF1-interacting nuclear factor 2 isoform X2 [Hyperolius riggenbachi]|uniref:TERF1-interacting nuclear factor 2 isoform X2 n=1 Tax=Hyperolius riggenbachi TaxID=752182 RepID=UPI0035A3CE55
MGSEEDPEEGPDLLLSRKTLRNSITETNEDAVSVVAGAVWQVMKNRDFRNFERIIELIEITIEQAPGLVCYRHYAKLNSGIRGKMILNMIEENRPLLDILRSLDIHFPSISADDAAAPSSITWKVQQSHMHFRQLILRMICDDKFRQHYVKTKLQVEYGEAFVSALENLLWEFLHRLETVRSQQVRKSTQHSDSEMENLDCTPVLPVSSSQSSEEVSVFQQHREYLFPSDESRSSSEEARNTAQSRRKSPKMDPTSSLDRSRPQTKVPRSTSSSQARGSSRRRTTVTPPSTQDLPIHEQQKPVPQSPRECTSIRFQPTVGLKSLSLDVVSKCANPRVGAIESDPPPAAASSDQIPALDDYSWIDKPFMIPNSSSQSSEEVTVFQQHREYLFPSDESSSSSQEAHNTTPSQRKAQQDGVRTGLGSAKEGDSYDSDQTMIEGSQSNCTRIVPGLSPPSSTKASYHTSENQDHLPSFFDIFGFDCTQRTEENHHKPLSPPNPLQSQEMDPIPCLDTSRRPTEVPKRTTQSQAWKNSRRGRNVTPPTRRTLSAREEQNPVPSLYGVKNKVGSEEDRGSPLELTSWRFQPTVCLKPLSLHVVSKYSNPHVVTIESESTPAATDSDHHTYSWLNDSFLTPDDYSNDPSYYPGT